MDTEPATITTPPAPPVTSAGACSDEIIALLEETRMALAYVTFFARNHSPYSHATKCVEDILERGRKVTNRPNLEISGVRPQGDPTSEPAGAKADERPSESGCSARAFDDAISRLKLAAAALATDASRAHQTTRHHLHRLDQIEIHLRGVVAGKFDGGEIAAFLLAEYFKPSKQNSDQPAAKGPNE